MTIFRFELGDLVQGAFWFLLGVVVSYALSHRKAIYCHFQWLRSPMSPKEARKAAAGKLTKADVNILIWNGGNIVISNDDISLKHPIIISVPGVITKKPVIVCSSAHIGATVDQLDKSRLGILFDFMNPRDAFEVRTCISKRGESDPSFACSGAIKGIRKGVQEFKIKPYADSVFHLVLFTFFLGLLVVFFFTKGPSAFAFYGDFFDGDLTAASHTFTLVEYVGMAAVLILTVPAIAAILVLGISMIALALYGLAGIPYFVEKRALEFDPPPPTQGPPF